MRPVQGLEGPTAPLDADGLLAELVRAVNERVAVGGGVCQLSSEEAYSNYSVGIFQNPCGGSGDGTFGVLVIRRLYL